MLPATHEPYRSIGGVRDLRAGQLLVLSFHRVAGWFYVNGRRVDGLALLHEGEVALLRAGETIFLVRARHYWRLVHGDLAA